VFEESYAGPPPLSAVVKIMLAIWTLILPPWLVVTAMTMGMAFEGGYTPDAYFSVITVWTYPVLVAAAWYFRRSKPGFVWMPMLTAIPLFVLLAFEGGR
jgi:hypothetical protein